MTSETNDAIKLSFKILDTMSTPFLRSMIAHAAIGGIARPAVNRAFPDGIPSFQQFYNEQEQTFGGLVPLMIKILKWSGIMLALLLLSGTSYGLFYSAIMPANYATEQLFFDYSRSSASPIQGIFTPRKIEDESFVTPWASVDLFASHTPWQAFHDDVLPSPRASKRLLQSRQAYYIEIVLKLPESEQNLKAGMFTVVTELLSHDGSQLAASRRSVRLPHMSRWISNTRKFICLIPLMIGAMDESRVLIIPAFRYFVESEQLPLVSPQLLITSFRSNARITHTRLLWIATCSHQNTDSIRFLVGRNHWWRTPYW